MTAFTKIVNKQLQAIIKPVSSHDHLEQQPMFAINWLDLNSKWMYSLYTYLAFPMARAVGAKAIFKGYQTQLIADSAQINRMVLLLVKYPGPHEFLSLVGRKFFQVISLLRIKAVRNFNLGFAHLLAGNAYPKGQEYLVYHFQGDARDHLLEKMKLLGSQNDIDLFYVAYKSATLSMIQKDKTREVHLPMDGLVIFTHTNRQTLLDFAKAPHMKHYMEGMTSNYLSLFKRVI